MRKKSILWRHQLWRHRNEIWDRKSDKFFTFVHRGFLQSITLWDYRYILLKEKLGSVDVLIGCRGVTWVVTMETLSPRYFWNQVLLLLSVSDTFKGNKVIQKSSCLSRPHGICWLLRLKKPQRVLSFILICFEWRNTGVLSKMQSHFF